MTDLMTLNDDELFRRAQQFHARGAAGDEQAREKAGRYVDEARRRFSRAHTLSAELEARLPISKRAWWKLW